MKLLWNHRLQEDLPELNTVVTGPLGLLLMMDREEWLTSQGFLENDSYLRHLVAGNSPVVVSLADKVFGLPVGPPGPGSPQLPLLHPANPCLVSGNRSSLLEYSIVAGFTELWAHWLRLVAGGGRFLKEFLGRIGNFCSTASQSPSPSMRSRAEASQCLTAASSPSHPSRAACPHSRQSSASSPLSSTTGPPSPTPREPRPQANIRAWLEAHSLQGRWNMELRLMWHGNWTVKSLEHFGLKNKYFLQGVSWHQETWYYWKGSRQEEVLNLIFYQQTSLRLETVLSQQQGQEEWEDWEDFLWFVLPTILHEQKQQ